MNLIVDLWNGYWKTKFLYLESATTHIRSISRSIDIPSCHLQRENKLAHILLTKSNWFKQLYNRFFCEMFLHKYLTDPPIGL